MLYAIIGIDRNDSLAARRQARPAHLARLEDLQAAGRLVLAGPLPATDKEAPGEAGFYGSLIVAEFSSWQDAKAWAAADPYVRGNIFQSITVQPFKQVLP